MKVSIAHIISFFSLFLWNNALYSADAFCSVATCASKISEKPTSRFDTLITASLPTSLRSHSDESNEVENDSDHLKKKLAMSDIRKARLDKESFNSKRFASGEELRSLREDLKSLKQNLEWVKALKDEIRIKELENAIRRGESRDPTHMYIKAQKIIAETKKMKDATEEGKQDVIDKWSKIAADAREFLPQLNMEGLWVGYYGPTKGLQVINITYSGDEMIATKVTGDPQIPRGKITFTVNAQPCNATTLPPVKLVRDHRSGAFFRFPGKGRVSRNHFSFVEGQMILFESSFSFVWIPTKHHVLFHRPTPEMILKLLRDTISKEDEMENMRNHLSRCFNMDLSTAVARAHNSLSVDDEPMRRITTQEELERVEEQMKQQIDHKKMFFQIGKWRTYIDRVLDRKNS